MSVHASLIKHGANEPNDVMEVRSLDKCNTTKAMWGYYVLSPLKEKLF